MIVTFIQVLSPYERNKLTSATWNLRASANQPRPHFAKRKHNWE